MSRSIQLRRITIMFFLFSALFFLIVLRLFWIQVIKGPELAAAAVQQRVQGLTMLSGRGDIQDRYGRSLLDRERHVGLAAFPVHYSGWEKELAELYMAVPGIDSINSPPLGSSPFWINSSVEQSILPDLPVRIPGIIAYPAASRYGPGLLASHTVGYLLESEGRGVSGIELAYDRELSQGQQEILALVVDGLKHPVEGLGYRLATSKRGSYNVVLSLDRNLQQKVELIVDRYLIRGAVVVMDPGNGDILALTSRPNFNPGSLADSYQEKGERQSALLNRAVCGYQPGSIFKTLVAAAALEEGLTGLFQTFDCPGGLEVSGLFMPCSHLHPENKLNLVEAFAHSCNTVFIQLALQLGGEKLSYYARLFGLGEPTGIPLEGQEGLLPSVMEMNNPRALANTAIGQGDVLTTPVQIARMMGIIANGGQDIKPRLVLALTDSRGNKVRNYMSWKGRRVISRSTANKLSYLMQAVTALGTGRSANVTEKPVGVKTGTAQSGRFENGREILNYWIAGFYPLDHPRAVIVVFADSLREGGVNQVFGEITRYLEYLE